MNRIDAEHIAFEEAARMLKEYRRKYRTARLVAIAAIAFLIGYVAVTIWTMF